LLGVGRSSSLTLSYTLRTASIIMFWEFLTG
jgi:hypothetical protein